MAARKGLHEVRTRVFYHLPINDEKQEKAFFRIIDYLDTQRVEDIGVNGYTHSSLRPAVFRGWWWPENSSTPEADDIVLLFVDYSLALEDRRLSDKLKEFKRAVRKWYRY